jgi:LPS sulfotransferase NodH
MPRPFVLLATQRTGSSWVQEMLGSHPELKVYCELFLIDARGVPLWEPNDIEFAASFVEARAARPALLTHSYWRIRYLRELLYQEGPQAVGFKYMYDQIPHSPEVLAYAALARVPVVHLVRRNLLDTVISAKRARASGVYHLPSDGRAQIPWLSSDRGAVSLRVDADDVLSELRRLHRQRQRMRRWLRLSGTPTCEVEYERLVGDRGEFGRVLEFLEISEPDVTLLDSALEKVTTERRSEMIENFSELEAKLAGTRFEALLGA